MLHWSTIKYLFNYRGLPYTQLHLRRPKISRAHLILGPQLCFVRNEKFRFIDSPFTLLQRPYADPLGSKQYQKVQRPHLRVC